MPCVATMEKKLHNKQGSLYNFIIEENLKPLFSHIFMTFFSVSLL